MNDKAIVLERVAKQLLSGNKQKAMGIIQEEYPFKKQQIFHRTYTLKQKIKIFLRDGFIDRYTGDRLVNPGFLKILSNYYKEDFPYHAHGKMTEGHIAYWEMFPTIDHVVPIAAGGEDNESNWITTSMLNNSIKSNWTLEQLRWELYNCGSLSNWDGLTEHFIKLVDNDEVLLNDNYIKVWYHASKNV